RCLNLQLEYSPLSALRVCRLQYTRISNQYQRDRRNSRNIFDIRADPSNLYLLYHSNPLITKRPLLVQGAFAWESERTERTSALASVPVAWGTVWWPGYGKKF
ncbi:hypothetical protein BC938DRAFT_484199, partial [Jimgerdemannia flammicorona]